MPARVDATSWYRAWDRYTSTKLTSVAMRPIARRRRRLSAPLRTSTSAPWTSSLSTSMCGTPSCSVKPSSVMTSTSSSRKLSMCPPPTTAATFATGASNEFVAGVGNACSARRPGRSASATRCSRARGFASSLLTRRGTTPRGARAHNTQLGKQLQVLGRHRSGVRAHVDDDGCLAGRSTWSARMFLPLKPRSSTPVGEAPGRGCGPPEPGREHLDDESRCVEGTTRSVGDGHACAYAADPLG